jgi:hypothetical protein
MSVALKFVSREIIKICDPVIIRDSQVQVYIQVRESQVDVTTFQNLLS